MAQMTEQEIQNLTERRKEIAFRGTKENGYADSGFWIFLNYVYTKDSHDFANAVKLLPVAEKDYLKVAILYMLACPRLLLPKSRQIMMSWLMSAFAVWHAMSAPYRLAVYQTKKELDAFAMVTKGQKAPKDGRMDFIIQNLPDWLRDENIGSGRGNKIGELVFNTEQFDSNGVMTLGWGSRIEAVPGGADQIASKTPSLVCIDEAAYHDSFGQVVVRALPALSGGGIFHAASSVNRDTDFNLMVLDTLDGAEPRHEMNETVRVGMDLMGIRRMPHGMRSWRTKTGFTVLETHYTADPDKDPERNGREWFEEAVKGYPGGVNGMGWQTEMEINYGAGGGKKVFPFLQQALSPIFVPVKPQSEVIGHMNLFAGYDYGTNSPSAFEVWGIDIKRWAWALWELYEPCINVAAHAARIKACPYFKHLEYIAADPSLFKKDQHRANGTLGSVAELFAEHGVFFIPAVSAVDATMALRFNSTYWSDPDHPTAFITDACPNLKMELRDLKMKENSPAVDVYTNSPEKLVQKNNHAWDASCYAFVRKPGGFIEKNVADSRNSIDAFLKRAEAEKFKGSTARRRGGIVTI